MRRARGQIDGGYIRKTVSLPASLVNEVEGILKPGETISMFMTSAAEREFDQRATKRRA